MPAATPVTTPVPEPTVAWLVLLLDHVPLPVASLNVVVLPTQTFVVPVMDAGFELTVTIAVAVQPVPVEYVMVAVPPETPVTTPVEEPTVATPIEPELHVPPLVPSVRRVVEPIHTDESPPIGATNGNGLIATGKTE